MQWSFNHSQFCRLQLIVEGNLLEFSIFEVAFPKFWSHLITLIRPVGMLHRRWGHWGGWGGNGAVFYRLNEKNAIVWSIHYIENTHFAEVDQAGMKRAKCHSFYIILSFHSPCKLMTSKSTGLTLLEAHSFNRWAAKKRISSFEATNVSNFNTVWGGQFGLARFGQGSECMIICLCTFLIWLCDGVLDQKHLNLFPKSFESKNIPVIAS